MSDPAQLPGCTHCKALEGALGRNQEALALLFTQRTQGHGETSTAQPPGLKTDTFQGRCQATLYRASGCLRSPIEESLV